MRRGTESERIGQIVETFFIVNAGKEKHVRAAAKGGMSGLEGIFRRLRLELLQENSVGNHPAAIVEIAGLEEVSFIRIEHVKEGGAIEHAPIAQKKGDLLLQSPLPHAPGIEHAVRSNHVGNSGVIGDAGGGLDNRIPDAVKVHHVHRWDQPLQFRGRSAGSEPFQTTARRDRMTRNQLVMRNRFPIRRDSLGGGRRFIRGDMNLMPQRRLRPGQTRHHRRWSSGGRVERGNDMKNSHADGRKWM
jgi:hypothetical protein